MLLPGTQTTATQQLLSSLTKFSMNPSSVQQTVLNVLELCLDGQDICDPTTPFIYLLESSATSTAAAIAASESVTRKLYPLLATNTEDIYRHMSDLDYVGIFASGATATIEVLLPYDLLLKNSIFINNSVDVKTTVIPRNSMIKVNDMELIIGYPIQINLLAAGIVQVLYDTTLTNPLMPLLSNVLTSMLVNYNNVNYLQVTVPVAQYNNATQVYVLNNSTAFLQTIPYTNQFGYVRAYLNSGTVQWLEMATTYSSQVYDITRPTLLVTVLANTLQVRLPDIYQSLNIAGNSLRIDVYTTRGLQTLDLSQIPSASYSATWADFDTLNPTTGGAVINTINDVAFFSTSMLSGGSDALPIEGLRNRAIYHVNSTIAPVRLTDLSITLNRYGYTLQKLIDSVTDRVFVASKALTARAINGLSTTPLATNANIIYNTALGLSQAGYSATLTTHNSGRSTILPTALYSTDNGNISLISDVEILRIFTLSAQEQADFLNAQLYLYSPFYYSIDYTNTSSEARAYHLDAPVIDSRKLIAGNVHQNYNINTTKAEITLVGDTYVLTLTASVPTSIPGLICQLAYYDTDNQSYVYMNATNTSIGATIQFSFALVTNFDIDLFDRIELLNLVNSADVISASFFKLTTTFNIFYLVPGSNVGLTTGFDNRYLATASMGPVIGATMETLTIKFGDILSNLYSPVRSLLSTGAVLTYTENVYAHYSADVYQQGALGAIYDMNTDSTISFRIEHHQGDVILDELNQPVLLHRIGDVILDANGHSIAVNSDDNSIHHLVGITLIDAKYRYATGIVTRQYADNIPNTIINYVANELSVILGQLNERTRLYYKPTGEAHVLQVQVGEGLVQEVSSLLDIQITFFMSLEGINNATVINTVKTITRRVISSVLQQTTISQSALSAQLTAAIPNQVVGFTIDQFLPDNIPIATLIDHSKTFTIRESMIVLPDGTKEVRDNVALLFKKIT